MVHALLLAAGESKRMGNIVPKQFLRIRRKTILEYTLDVFERCSVIDEIHLLIPEGFEEFVKDVIGKYKKLKKTIPGGKTRRESSYLGLKSLNALGEDIVVIHDAVRPFIDCELIKDVVEAAVEFGSSSAAVESTDTIVEIDEEGFFHETLERRKLRRVQTPQAFKYSIIMKAHERALSEEGIDEIITDDCGLVMRYGISRVKVVEGRVWNFKITYPFDVELARMLLNKGIIGNR